MNTVYVLRVLQGLLDATFVNVYLISSNLIIYPFFIPSSSVFTIDPTCDSCSDLVPLIDGSSLKEESKCSIRCLMREVCRHVTSSFKKLVDRHSSLLPSPADPPIVTRKDTIWWAWPTLWSPFHLLRQNVFRLRYNRTISAPPTTPPLLPPRISTRSRSD